MNLSVYPSVHPSVHPSIDSFIYPSFLHIYMSCIIHTAAALQNPWAIFVLDNMIEKLMSVKGGGLGEGGLKPLNMQPK